MKKTFFLFVVCLLLCAAGSVYAIDGVFAGLGVEISEHTCCGYASLSAGGILGLEFIEYLAVGLKSSFFHDLNHISAFEVQGFLRVFLSDSENTSRFFLQWELGAAMFNGHDGPVTSISGGAGPGLRVSINEDWHVDTALRIGYPYMWGIGVTINRQIWRNTPRASERR